MEMSSPGEDQAPTIGRKQRSMSLFEMSDQKPRVCFLCFLVIDQFVMLNQKPRVFLLFQTLET